jgi:hypothetical protein
MKTLMSTLTLITVAAGLAVAADKPDFSGNWKVDSEKSVFGPIPPPSAMTRTVEQKGSDISMKQSMIGPDMDFTMKYLADGKETVNTFMGTDVKSKATWEGNSLMIRNSLGAEPVSTNKWTLSNDGKIWTDVWSVSSPQGSFEVTYIFVRQ